jgi:hypothetical protein
MRLPIHYTLQNHGNPLIWGNSPHFPSNMMERWQLKLSSSAATKALEMLLGAPPQKYPVDIMHGPRFPILAAPFFQIKAAIPMAIESVFRGAT